MSKEVKAPSLNGDKIMEQYPRVIAAYKKWLDNLPNAEVLGQDKLIYDNAIKAIFYYNPRSLYEFFDTYGIELLINRVDESHWSYHITSTPHSHSADSRILAEELGFGEAFESLENQLSK